jgi:hypothetical protein
VSDAFEEWFHSNIKTGHNFTREYYHIAEMYYIAEMAWLQSRKNQQKKIDELEKKLEEKDALLAEAVTRLKIKLIVDGTFQAEGAIGWATVEKFRLSETDYHFIKFLEEKEN